MPEQIDEVRNDTKRILKKIPADYNGMNEEQYIVIQSIHNTYDSYDTICRSITESNLSVYMDKAFYEPEHCKTNFNAVG